MLLCLSLDLTLLVSLLLGCAGMHYIFFWFRILFLVDLPFVQGCFEILTLRGSYTASYNDIGIKTWTGGLSVSLVSRSDGRFIVGGVASLLMAASPIKVH